MKFKVVIFVLVVVLFIPILCLSADVVVIANPQVSTSVLNKKDIANIFLGRKTIWDDRTKIVVFLQKDSDIHQTFLNEYIDKSPRQFSQHWKKMIFTGKASALRVLDSNQEMIKIVEQTKGAIGYISSDTKLENVKSINLR